MKGEVFKENPDTVHGRLLESVHNGTYTMERACVALEYLLAEDRWKAVGKGFENIDDFLETIRLEEFKIAIDKRKTLSKKLADLHATQRATAKALGVGPMTIHRDVTNGTKEDVKVPQNDTIDSVDVPYVTQKEEQKEKIEQPSILQNPADEMFKKMEKNVHVENNSGENEWYTPVFIIDAARKVMGSIDTDPASSALANETVKAGEYFTKENSGLTQSWKGNVWLNPPYAQPLISEFCKKVKTENKNYNQAIILVNNGTETGWFGTLVSVASAICFPKSRIKFIDKAGNPSGAPLQGQAIVYIGESEDKFISIFKEIGWTARIEE